MINLQCFKLFITAKGPIDLTLKTLGSLTTGVAVNKIPACLVAVIPNPAVCDVCVF